jgi:type II secretory pathway pseudopilin PulG
MSPCRRSTRRSLVSRRAGFSTVELLVGVSLISLAIAATSGFFLATNSQMRQQALRTEADQAARSSIDMIIRELRLGGACLPVVGSFISLEGQDDGDEDEITTRTGLVRPDLSCIRAALISSASQNATSVKVDSVDGFSVGMRARIERPTGVGEYATITSVNTSTKRIFLESGLSRSYAATSCFYAIDERRFYINHFTGPRGVLPELMVQVGDDEPTSFAVGIEKLDVEYQLRRNCPPCDVVDEPAGYDEWSIVEQIFVTVTARAELLGLDDDYYRRTIRVGVKPRNLLPR